MRVLLFGVASLCLALTALFLAQPTEAESRSYSAPKTKDVRLDWCLHWARDCGKPAADFFCREQGYSQASKYSIDPNVGARGIKTLVAGDGRICDAPNCSGFRVITCDRPATSVLGPVVPPSGGGGNKPAVTTQSSPLGPGIKSYQDLNKELEQCQAESKQLRGEIELLSSIRNELAKKLAERDKTIADMTSKGGSLVRAYCQSETLSKNTTGKTTNCGAYQCEPVSGLCRNRCATTGGDCAVGYYCDPDKGNCIRP